MVKKNLHTLLKITANMVTKEVEVEARYFMKVLLD